MRSDSFISNHRSDRNKAIILWYCFVVSVASITATSCILQPKLLSSFFTTHSLLGLFSSPLSKHPEGNLRYHHRHRHNDVPMTAAVTTTNDDDSSDIQTNKIRHRFDNHTNSTNSNETPQHDSLLLLHKNDIAAKDSVVFVSDLIRIPTEANVSSNKRRLATTNSSSSDDDIKNSSSIDRNNSVVRSSSNDDEGDDEESSVLFFVHMFCYVCIGMMLLYVCRRLSKCGREGFSGVTLTTGRTAMSEYTLSRQHRQHQLQNNPDVDNGPISTEAGLAGMTYKERELILQDVFKLTTFQYDATKSLFTQIAYRKKQEPKKDTHLLQSLEMKKSNTFVTNENSIQTDDDVGDVADDDLSSNDINDDESFVVDDDNATNDGANAPDKTSSTTDHMTENNYNVENGTIDNSKQEDDIDETAQLSAPSLSPSAACPLKGEQVVVPQETTIGDVNDDIDGCDTDCISCTNEHEVKFPTPFNKTDDDDNVTITSATTLSDARSVNDNVIIECLGDGNHINDDDASSAIATCSICLETFKDGCTIITGTQCNHVFHEECCFEWYRKNDLCPYCRTEIMDQNEMRTAAVRTLGKDRVVELQRRNFCFSIIP